MNSWLETATRLAGGVYAAFMQEVVEQHVLAEREGVLSEEGHQRLAKNTHIDTRVIRLMAISGKGGWSADPEKRQRFAVNTNVTLLDHLLSVIRGALLLYALDKLGQNPEMDEGLLRRRLRVIAVIAFLHDLDKLLKLERNTQLPLGEIEATLKRYGIIEFLGTEIILTAEQIRYLIELVEDTQRHRSPPVELPPRDYEPLMAYVALADKLDSIWLSSDPEKGGLRGVLDYLGKVRTLNTDLLRQWQTLDIFDPHHPFLLDELQRWLSFFSLRLTGIPPLLEVHHDGRLFMLLPAGEYKMIVDKAIQRLGVSLPFQLELNISNRGIPALYNGQPDHEALINFMSQLPLREIGRLFLLKAELQTKVTTPLDQLLGNRGLAPRWPRAAGALASPYAMLEDLNIEAEIALRQAAHLVLLLNLNLPVSKKNKLPDYTQREQRLLMSVRQNRPDWLETIEDGASRRALTALWVLALTAGDLELEKTIWGQGGLLQRWLEGEDQEPGFNTFIEGRGAKVTTAVERHFRQLLAGQPIMVEDNTALGRCLFTDEPVTFDDTIDDALGLYEVRVSAFSGRDNRPETITSERAHTNVGPVSVAEHKLRARIHEQAGGRPDGVPTLISSPSTSGLFGGLGLDSDKAAAAMSLYDLSRQDVKKGTVYRGTEIYRGRYRMARFESIPERLYARKQTSDTGQIVLLTLLLKACRRLGRPLHVFRGLPTPQQAFFYYDAMPRVLADLIGGNGLRLEQLPAALQQLQFAQILLETPGLGYDVLRLYATSATRFSAICLAWCHLRDRDGNNQILSQLQTDYFTSLENPIMFENSGPLVRLGQAAAQIQRRPLGKSSANEELLVFKLCMEAANAARAAGQDDESSLIYAIAGELETNLVRKEQAAASRHRDGKSLRDGCLEIAELFVRTIWNDVLKHRPPSQRNRRILGSIYRMAFLQAVRNQSENPVNKTPA